MPVNSDIQVKARAYAKMVLHATKYPHCAVNGVLLAKECAMNCIEDAIPLFHQIQGLTPMAEVALAQADLLAGRAKLVVAGFYHANERLEDVTVDIFSQRIADVIAANNETNRDGTCTLLTVDNKLLGSQLPAVLAHVRSEGRWKSLEEPVQVDESAIEVASILVQKRANDLLVDFDNHLDDLKKDFLNVDLNMEIDKLC